jgi:hypothetical protein
VDARAVDAGVPELVVARLGVRASEDLVGLRGLLERGLGVLVPRVAVRMELEGELAVRLLDVLLGRVPGNPEDLVVVASSGGRRHPSRVRTRRP